MGRKGAEAQENEVERESSGINEASHPHVQFTFWTHCSHCRWKLLCQIWLFNWLGCIQLIFFWIRFNVATNWTLNSQEWWMRSHFHFQFNFYLSCKVLWIYSHLFLALPPAWPRPVETDRRGRKSVEPDQIYSVFQLAIPCLAKDITIKPKNISQQQNNNNQNISFEQYLQDVD